MPLFLTMNAGMLECLECWNARMLVPRMTSLLTSDTNPTTACMALCSIWYVCKVKIITTNTDTVLFRSFFCIYIYIYIFIYLLKYILFADLEVQEAAVRGGVWRDQDRPRKWIRQVKCFLMGPLTSKKFVSFFILVGFNVNLVGNLMGISGIGYQSSGI